MGTKLIVSYSHADAAFWDEFRKALEPYQANLEIDIWSDLRIPASQDWHKEIEQAIAAARVGVCLVSKDFLASPFIRGQEMPPLLVAAEMGRIALTALFLGPCAVDDDDAAFAIPGLPGGEARIKLTKYQGLNRPDEHVIDAPPATRDAILTSAARKLIEVIKSQDQGRWRSAPGDRPELTVRLKFVNDRLVCRYRSNWQDLRVEVHSPFERPIRDWQSEGMAALEEANFGDSLFAALFGPDEAKAQEIIQQAMRGFSKAPASPIRHPLRVRIQTEDDRLASLPWTRTSWRGRALSEDGWTFELTTAAAAENPHSSENVEFFTPCTVLAVIPDADSRERHVGEIRELLTRASPTFKDALHVAADLDEARESIRRALPRVIYYFGSAFHRDGKLRLELPESPGAEPDTPLDAFRATWERRAPAAVFLNVVTRARTDLGGAPAALLGEVPLVVTQSWWGEAIPARQAALAWMHEVLESPEAVDPVAAAHSADRGLKTAAVWTRYARWTTRREAIESRTGLAELMLDRRLHRSEVDRAVHELIEEDGRRMCGILAFGTKDNLVERLSAQSLEYLRSSRRETAEILRIQLTLPSGPANPTASDFEFHLRRDLNISPVESLASALARRKPRVSGRRRPVILLDWECSNRDHQATMSAWVDFCEGRLARICPDDLRIVAFLVFEVLPDIQGSVAEWAEGLRAERAFSSPSFRFEVLPLLDRVAPADLGDFMTRKQFCSCPPDLVRPLAELIVRKTSGRFDETVKHLEQGERTSWLGLKAELEAGGRPS
jgi:hypothetical protein